MNAKERKELLDEHVRLTAQFGGGNTGAAKRLAEIEQMLEMDAAEIMKEALTLYNQEY